MVPTENTLADRHHRQARNIVLIALMIAFFGAMLGVVFGIALGTVTGPEAWIIGLCAVVTGGMVVPVYLKLPMATGVITGALTIYFVFHLNPGAIIAYQASGDVVRIIPYVVWFFPLVVFHQLTNFGFYKRWITGLVGLGPIPISVYVLVHLTDPVAIGVVDAVVTFLTSFFAFVLFVGVFTRHRDDEIQHAAMAEEADRTAAVLRVSEERFRLLGLATNDLVWDADLKSGRIWWSESLFDTYGYHPRGPATHMNTWESWIHPEERDRVTRSLRSVIESGGSNWNSEFRFVCADNRTLDVVARGLVLRDETGEPVRVIGSMADVTELRELEKKLRQSQKMEAVGQLTGGIAHDFNNLLTVILGNAEMLAERVSDPGLRRMAEMTVAAADRGAELTNRLLAFARRQPLDPKPVDVNRLVEAMQTLIRRTLPESVDVRLVLDPGAGLIEIDASELDTAMLNLFVNARDAMPDGGRLTIETANVLLDSDYADRHSEVFAGEFVMVCVSDTGSGMDPETVRRAFEPFYTTKAVGKGSGLGLSMVFGFTKQSGGHVKIYSEPGEGTAVKLYFPRTHVGQESSSRSAVELPLPGGTEHVLIAEDDDLVLEHLKSQLLSLGYRVTSAMSGPEALDALQAHDDIDLLLSDIVMPGGMNGRELADRALAVRPSLKVMFTSGYTENAIVHRGRLDSGVVLLSKPYTRLELATKVRQVLQESET